MSVITIAIVAPSSAVKPPTYATTSSTSAGAASKEGKKRAIR